AWSMYPEKAVVAAWRNVPSIEAPQSYTTTTANLTIDGDSIELQAAKIGAGFMAFTGLHPIVGRSFDTTETVVGGPPVVMLAERMWRERFAASREVIGRRITLSGKRFTVVGVAPATLELPAIAQPRTAVWLPLIEDNESLSPPVLLRLARDVDPHLVERELDSVAVRIRPAAFDGPRFHY